MTADKSTRSRPHWLWPAGWSLRSVLSSNEMERNRQKAGLYSSGLFRGRALRRTDRQADVPGPLVRQIEGLAHVKAQRAQPAGQVLQRPQHGSLNLHRGPLAELVVIQVRLQGLGDRCWDAPMRLLPPGRQYRVSRLMLRQAPFRPRAIPKQHPLERDPTNPALPCPQDDRAGGIHWEVFALGPFLHCRCGDRLAELCGELSIRQRDTFPVAEHCQEGGEAPLNWAQFGSVFGLDRFQCDSKLAT